MCPKLIPISASDTCVCGTRRTLLVLADFPDYPHLSSKAEVGQLFFGRVARYFCDVSYGKLSVTGNATEWITLPKLYGQYTGTDGTSGIAEIADDAFVAASRFINMTSFDDFMLVLSFYPSLTADMVRLVTPIATKTGSIGRFAVVEEDRDWTTYARGYGLMIGLSRYETQLSGLGFLDLAASGQGDMTIWSKLILGWINESQVVKLSSPFVRSIVTLDPNEAPGSDPLAIRLELGEGLGIYWIEDRQPIGYDRNTLQDYGAVITYLKSSNSSAKFIKVLQPDSLGSAVFLNPDLELSMIALNQTQGRIRILLGDAQDGRDAQEALYAILRASDAVQIADSASRIEGLGIAQQLLSDAHTQFALAQFKQADALAISAETMANSATIPQDYYQASQLLGTAGELRNETLGVTSSQASQLVVQANAALQRAKDAFAAKNFGIAEQNAQSAIDLFNSAQRIDLTEKILWWIGNLALIIPVAILAFALRYQLKGNWR
jgi:hypothetical protein